MANRPRRPKSESDPNAATEAPGASVPETIVATDETAPPTGDEAPGASDAAPAPPAAAAAPTASSPGDRSLPPPEDQPVVDGEALRRAQAGGSGTHAASLATASDEPSATESFAAEEGLAAKAGETPRRHLGEFEDDETATEADARPRPVTDAYAGGTERPITHDANAAGRASTGSLVGAGLAGAVLALLGGSLLVYSGLVPAPGSAQTSSQYASAGDVEGLSSEVAGLREAVGQLQSADAAGGTGGFASASDLGALSDRLTALEQGEGQASAAPAETGPVVDEEARTNVASAQEAAGAAQARADEAQALASEVDGRLASLVERLDAIEAEQSQSRIALAAAGLKAAIDRGGPFAPELEGFASAGGASEAVEPLRAFAADGVPTARQLAEEWPEAEADIRRALVQPDENAGVGDQILAGLSSLVTVRSSGEAAAEGTGPDAALARMNAAIEAGDLAAWQRAWEALDPAARAAGQPFADRVAARLQASTILDSALGGASEATPANAG